MNRAQRRTAERLLGSPAHQVATEILRYGNLVEFVEAGVVGYIAARMNAAQDKPDAPDPAQLDRAHLGVSRGLAALETARDSLDVAVAALGETGQIPEVDTLRGRLAIARQAFDYLPPLAQVH